MLDIFITNFDLMVKIGTGLLALVPVVLFIKSKIIKPCKKIFKNINSIEEIYNRLGPNGGKSLYDKIVNIDNRLARADIRKKSLIDALDIPEWHSDEQGQCIYINSSACKLLNRTAEEFLGRNWVNVISPSDKERVIAEWDAAVKEKRTFICEFHWLRFNGDSIPIKAVAYPVIDSSNHLTGWVSFVQTK